MTTGLVAIEAVIGRFGPRVLDNIIDGRNVPTPSAMGAEQVDDLLHDIGELRGPNPNREILVNEDILIDLSHGLQTRSSGTFENVVNGQYLDPDSKYLYTIDEGGVNIALEQTPFDTPRGTIVHTNISDRAVVGGEAWFGLNNTVTINAGSGRFGDGAGITESQWNATIRYWENLGYTVNPIPFGQR